MKSLYAFGELIKKKRLELNLKLSEVAERVGVSTSYLSRLETNLNKQPSFKITWLLAETLNITNNELKYAFNIKNNNSFDLMSDRKLISDKDIEPFKKGQRLLFDVANGKDADVDMFIEVMKVFKSLQKKNVCAIGISQKKQYIISIQTNDNKVLDFVADKIVTCLQADVIFIGGELLSMHTDTFADEYDLFSFIDFLELINDNNSEELSDIKEMREYLKQIQY